jgi:hypothetical protein
MPWECWLWWETTDVFLLEAWDPDNHCPIVRWIHPYVTGGAVLDLSGFFPRGK